MGWAPGAFWAATPADFWHALGGWKRVHAAGKESAAGRPPVSYDDLEYARSLGPRRAKSVRRKRGRITLDKAVRSGRFRQAMTGENIKHGTRRPKRR